MKFLITIRLSVLLVLALGTSSNAQGNNRPCMPTQNQNAYSNFLLRHILPAYFDPNVAGEWTRHITNIRRCNTRLQSFIPYIDKESVELICNGGGRTLAGQTNNLCISDFTMPIYHVVVNTATCEPQYKPSLVSDKVIVACDQILNGCHPVHFEKNRGQRPGNFRCEPPNVDFFTS